jgi:hypothetical protein
MNIEIDKDEQIRQLKEELQSTKETLQSTKEHLKRYTAPSSRREHYKLNIETERAKAKA